MEHPGPVPQGTPWDKRLGQRHWDCISAAPPPPCPVTVSLEMVARQRGRKALSRGRPGHHWEAAVTGRLAVPTKQSGPHQCGGWGAATPCLALAGELTSPAHQWWGEEQAVGLASEPPLSLRLPRGPRGTQGHGDTGQEPAVVGSTFTLRVLALSTSPTLPNTARCRESVNIRVLRRAPSCGIPGSACMCTGWASTRGAAGSV